MEILRKTSPETYQSQQLTTGRWAEERKKARPLERRLANAAVIEDKLGRVSPKQEIHSADPVQDNPMEGKTKTHFV